MMGFSRAMGDAGRRAEAPPPTSSRVQEQHSAGGLALRVYLK